MRNKRGPRVEACRIHDNTERAKIPPKTRTTEDLFDM